MDTTEVIKGELTNGCTCVTYNDETGDFDTAPECWGDCWDTAVEDFETVTEAFRNTNETGWWKVENLRLWNGEASGYFHADKVADLITGMTVRAEWTMRYTVFADRIEYSLSHHDAPMGSASVLRAISEDERERLGLY